MSRHLGELEQLVLLAILNLGDDAYGVTIRRTLAERCGRSVALATIYTTLDRLDAKGFVHTRLGEPTPERGGRRKRYYRPSALGRSVIAKALAAVRALTTDLDEGWQP